MGQAGAGVNWVRFAYLGRGPSWGRGELGSFRIFGVGRDTWYAGIGFVLHFLVLGQAGAGVNWVRFA